MGYEDGIEYGITRKYVETRNWGKWEIFREFVQNALDEMHEVREARPREYPCRVEFRALTPVTIIEDRGRGLGIHHLLIGTSEKKPWQRGKFGEGLKLALLASAHLDYKVVIRSEDKEITPTFVTRIIEGVPVDVFCVCYKRVSPRIGGTRVEIHGASLCDEYRTRFVQGLRPECIKFTFEAKEWYDLIDKKCTENRSHVYIRDIYVSTMEEAVGKPACFSYNLFNVAIDESRRIPSSGSVREDVRFLWRIISYRASGGDQTAYEALKEILKCIVSNCRPGYSPEVPVEVDMDTFAFVYGDAAVAVRRAFEELYGEDTVFVYDDDLRAFADYVGVKYIYCPQPVGYGLQRILNTIEKLRKHVERTVRSIIRKEEMNPRTRRIVEILEEIARLIFLDLVVDKSIQYGLLEESVQGMCDTRTRTIVLNILNLENNCKSYLQRCLEWYIGTLGHELAHLYSRATDGTVEFERGLTEVMVRATIGAIVNRDRIVELLGELDAVIKS
jgi:hypothetical protein